ncbi:MAG: sugar kinase [Methylobacteriaceae bacterium]|nr:sugar kinase [Methylobacteriaceae bacterium]
MTPSLLGLGDNTIDSYVDLSRQFPGGNAVNVAVLAARHGARAAYLGCIGKDDAGALLFRALAAEGVATDRCRLVDGPNARAFIAHNKGDRRFIRSERGVRGAWGGFDRADLDYIAGFDLVHSSVFSELEPHMTALRPAIRRWSFDVSERWTADSLVTLAAQVDALFLSAPNEPDGACADMARGLTMRGARCVVVTRGARGAVAARAGEVAACDAAPAEIVDTLGAGDAFIAAFLLADLADASLRAALESGALAAASACGRFGAFGHGEAWTQAA